MYKLADLLEKHTDELCALEALNVGASSNYKADYVPMIDGLYFVT